MEGTVANFEAFAEMTDCFEMTRRASDSSV
jgi:hypothetical protein